MQDALFAAWGVDPGLALCWRQSFFYRTITLDGRWLLTEPNIPSFDVSLFAQLLPRFSTDAGRDLLVESLTNDPVTRQMPEVFQHIADNAPAEASHGLRVINGGLDA